VVLVLVVGLLLVATIKPAWHLFETYRLAGQTKVRLHEAQAENEILERRVKRARSEATLRREARRQGMIMPGEQAWVVNGIK
jgi:cell division protein FtsB